MCRWGCKRCLWGKNYYQAVLLFSVYGVLLFARPGIAASKTGNSIAIDDGSVSAEIEVIDSFQAEQEHLKKLLADKPRAYQDKFMSTEDLSGLDTEPEEDDSAPNGLRVYSLESRIDFADSSATHAEGGTLATAGIRSEYRLEVPNRGEIVFQLDARGRNTAESEVGNTFLATDGKQQNNRVTIRNIGMPVTTEVLADTSAGDINSEITDALSRNYRLTLGSSPVRGVGTHVYGKDFDLRAGTGQRGELRGSPYPGFEETEGKLSWLGYSQKIGENIQAGLQLNQAQDIPVLNLDTGISAGQTENVSSLAASVSYGHEQLEDGELKARATLVSSKASADVAGRNQTANGLFLETSLRQGRFRHEVGAYASQPNLHFGDSLLLSNNQGAYWRVDRESARLNLGGAVDFEQSRPTIEAGGLESKRVGLNANALYQLNRDDQLGGNIHISDTHTSNENSSQPDGHSRSTNINLNYQTRFNDMGRSRFSATLRRNETLVSNGAAATGDEIQWEQDWITGKYETMRPELTTTLGIAHDRSAQESQTYPTASINARHWLDADWNVSGNLRYTSRNGNLATSQGLAGTLATEYKLGREWQIGASASINEAKVTYSGNSLTEPEVVRTNDKHVYAYLRWQKTTGKPFQTLGNRQAGVFGSGDINGTVFFDENRDGQQQAGEAGAPGVEVVLDGHYRATTDSNGVFRFVQVATGPHQIDTNLDTVPLPWEVAGDTEKDVNVILRDQVSLKISLNKIN